jgi:uncharacterized membrane protein
VIDDELKLIALALIGMMAVIAVYPVLSANRVVEPFTELGVLGPNGKLGDYPKEVGVDEKFNLFLYLGNHEGRAQYYRVLAKLGNQASNVTDTQPMDAPILASWDVLLLNEQNSTIPVILSIGEAGVNLRLVFELYRFNTESSTFVYHERWIQLWMNVTKTT